MIGESKLTDDSLRQFGWRRIHFERRSNFAVGPRGQGVSLLCHGAEFELTLVDCACARPSGDAVQVPVSREYEKKRMKFGLHGEALPRVRQLLRGTPDVVDDEVTVPCLSVMRNKECYDRVQARQRISGLGIECNQRVTIEHHAAVHALRDGLGKRGFTDTERTIEHNNHGRNVLLRRGAIVCADAAPTAVMDAMINAPIMF
jgi:hypothetical protein